MLKKFLYLASKCHYTDLTKYKGGGGGVEKREIIKPTIIDSNTVYKIIKILS
jgi:hypothetical protein